MYQEQEYFDKLALDYLELQKDPHLNNIKINHILESLKCLVYIRSSKYKKYSNAEDLEQEGFEGLVMALKTYKPNTSSFTWWADKYISTRITRAANAHSVIRVPMAKIKDLKPIKVDELPAMISSDTPEKISIQKEFNNVFELSMKKLSTKEIVVINCFYGIDQESMSIKEISKKFSWSDQETIKLLKKAKKVLKKAIKELME